MKKEGLGISSELHIIKSLLEIFKEILYLKSKFHDSSALNKKLGKNWEDVPAARLQWAQIGW